MGISIEQYRARIGTHNCIRMKNYTTCLQDSFRRMLLMLLIGYNNGHFDYVNNICSYMLLENILR